MIARGSGNEARLVFGLPEEIRERAAHLERAGGLVGLELEKDRTVARALRPNEPGGRQEGANDLEGLLDQPGVQPEPGVHHA